MYNTAVSHIDSIGHSKKGEKREHTVHHYVTKQNVYSVFRNWGHSQEAVVY
jgi:hypothetical protein